MQAGKKIKFMSINKVTKDLYNQYKSNIKEVKLSGFDEFLALYDPIYDDKIAEVITSPYLEGNGNYYCTILINGEKRPIFLEFIKYFTNIKSHVTLDENLFTL